MPKFLKIYNNFLFVLVLVLLIFIPLYPKLPLLNVKGTFVAIRLEDLIIAVSLGVWGFYIILKKETKVFLNDNLNKALLLFFFIGAVSLFSAVFLTKTVVFHLGILHYLRRIELMMLMPMSFTAVRRRGQLKVILWILSGVLLLVNLYALGQKYLNWPVISTTNSEFSKGLILYLTPGARVNSTFAGHYDLAVFLAISLILISAFVFINRKLIYLFWLSILSVLSFYILILTAARVSFVAAAVGIAGSLILSGRKKLLLFFFLIMVASMIYPSDLRNRFISTIIVDLGNGGARYFSNSDTSGKTNLNIPTLPVKTSSLSAEATKSATSSSKVASDIAPGEPLNTTELGVYRSWTIRLNYEWPEAIRYFLKNPLLGTGYSSIGLASDNDFLRSLAEVGLLGTMAFGLIIWEILKHLKMSFNNENKIVRAYAIATFSIVIAVLINGTFIDVFESSKVATIFWLLMGVGIALSKVEK